MLQRGGLSGFAACHEAAEKLARLASSGLMALPGCSDNSALHWQLIQGATVSSEQVHVNALHQNIHNNERIAESCKEAAEEPACLNACSHVALLAQPAR